MDRSGGALLIFAGVWGVSRERRINSGHESIDLPFYRKNLPNSPPLFFSFVIDDDDEESNDRFLSDVQKEKGFASLSLSPSRLHQRKGWWTLDGYFRSPPLSWKERVGVHARATLVSNA